MVGENIYMPSDAEMIIGSLGRFRRTYAGPINVLARVVVCQGPKNCVKFIKCLPPVVCTTNILYTHTGDTAYYTRGLRQNLESRSEDSLSSWSPAPRTTVKKSRKIRPRSITIFRLHGGDFVSCVSKLHWAATKTKEHNIYGNLTHTTTHKSYLTRT